MMVGFSAVTGFFAITFMMYWLRRASFAPFVDLPSWSSWVACCSIGSMSTQMPACS